MDRLTRPRAWLFFAVLAMLLGLPSLELGLQLDDHFLRLAFSDPPKDPAWARAPHQVFAFFDGSAASNQYARETGAQPWWAATDLRLAFYRPLSSLSHWLDFQLYPERPLLMHVHSLLWFGVMVGVAAVAFRSLPLAPAAAGLAGLVFALDDGHGVPAVWVANRNALLATSFALAALLAHDRWRRSGWRHGAWLAPLLLLLGLLSGEMAVGAGGYLLAHALFLDTGPWRRRLFALLPCGAVGLVWALVYRAGGYGAHGSVLYVDPAHGSFVEALALRLPLLIAGQFTLPPELYGVLSVPAQRWAWLLACVVVVGVAGLLWPLLRRDAMARFAATGMLLAMLPACATVPNGRLLVLASFGGACLVALCLLAARAGASAGFGAARRALALPLFAVHLVLAPLGLLGATSGTRMLGNVVQRMADGIPADPAVRGQELVVMTTPSAFATMQGLAVASLAGQRPLPANCLILSSGLAASRFERVDERTLAVEVAGGFLPIPGSLDPAGAPQPAILDPAYMLQFLDRLYRVDPFRVGDQMPLRGVQITIEEITADGRAARVRFQFPHALDDPSYRFVVWNGTTYQDFALPAPGTRWQQPARGVAF